MKDIVIDTFLAVKDQVNPSHRQNHFELFGFDFMIDEDFRVWLIESNSNPYIGQPNAWTKKFVPKMVDEMLQIVLDPIYTPNDSYYEKHRGKERGYEIIYSEGNISNVDYISMGQTYCNQRRPFEFKYLYPNFDNREDIQ